MRYAYLPSPLGDVLAVRDDVGLTGLYLTTPEHPKHPDAQWQRDDAAFADVRTQLAEYFAGTRRDFDLPLHPNGTPFQQRVWAALREIPYGATSSYGRTASAIGAPDSARAVGAANGRNPIWIVVPCHRVIGANGKTMGYAGGVATKQWLLAHESGHADLFS